MFCLTSTHSHKLICRVTLVIYDSAVFYTKLSTVLREFPGWAAKSVSGPPRVTLLRHAAALGDCIMLSALARELKNARPDWRVAIVSRWPDLFKNNPHVNENYDWHLLRTRYTVSPRYKVGDLQNGTHQIIAQWRRLWEELSDAGAVEKNMLPPLKGIYPEVFLTPAELDEARAFASRLTGSSRKPLVLISSGGKTKPTHNREWGVQNAQAVVDVLEPCVSFLQVSGDAPLMVGGQKMPYVSVNVRAAAALFAISDAMLIQEGGQMHLARAVNARAVVIFGGFILPSQSGYPEHTNLWSQPECSPCLEKLANCEHLKCMLPITPRRVVEELAKMIAAKCQVKIPEAAINSAPNVWTPPSFVNRERLNDEMMGANATKPNLNSTWSPAVPSLLGGEGRRER